MRDDRFCNSNCPFTRAIGTIGNKWKPIIINVIGNHKESTNRTAKGVGRRWAIRKIGL